MHPKAIPAHNQFSEDISGMSDNKWVYLFSEGSESMRNLLGGKGAGSAEMTKAGMPVPPGFTITTEACLDYFANDKNEPEGLADQIQASLATIEKQTGRGFGNNSNPLLVSVRSGARASMPGMMDTVLNLGLNAETLQGLATRTGDDRFAWDSYRRFIQGYGSIVLGVESHQFEELITEHKLKLGKSGDTELTAEEWQSLTGDFKTLVKTETDMEFPDSPYEQLMGAVRAVFDSWYGKRAMDYRAANNLPHDWGTAVNVQTMVFGNMGANSGTGVAFTRDSITGEKVLFGEYLLNAQGEDVVAGVRTPEKIQTLQDIMPDVYDQFLTYANQLENHYKEMQDLEFTIESGELFMLQTRAGKRSPRAAVKIAVDMVGEGLIDKRTALERVEAEQVNAVLHPQVDPVADISPAATGLNASPGAASGQAIFTADEADELGRSGQAVILVRPETSPDDFHGMVASKAILTARGGATSHAAIVARQLGLPAVVGCEEIKVNLKDKSFQVGEITVNQGDLITVDGTTGNIILGEAPLIKGEITDDLETLLEWADSTRKLDVWANADTPEEALLARNNGATGIGLCRTEHMFREGDRLPIVQEMILAADEKGRQSSLDQLLPIQRSDFKGILKAMHGLPVIIRLLDPPLHEFLHSIHDIESDLDGLRAAGKHNALKEAERMLARARDLHEANPMLGLRGCRLGIVYPEVYEMQVRAIIESAIELKQDGVEAKPEIMIPLVGHINELLEVENRLRNTALTVQNEHGVEVSFKFGTMMEVPRACLTADEIAKQAEFFSFGTNDLTQTTYGISRDDAEGKFLLKYVEDGILPANPFQVLDNSGVGELMKIAVEKGRAARSDIEIGICGEHGGDPDSVHFCHELGLDYVSCSPYRVPVARIAASHAAIGKAPPADV